jgi:hypothetical protein
MKKILLPLCLACVLSGVAPSPPCANPMPYELWFDRTFGTGENDAALCAVRTADDGLVFAGYATRPGRDKDVWVAKIDRDGEPVWSLVFGDTGTDVARGIMQNPDGSFLVVGDKATYNRGQDPMICMISADGQLLWTKVGAISGIHDDALTGIVGDSSGNVWVVGYTYNFTPDSMCKLLLARLDPGGGILNCIRVTIPARELFSTSIAALPNGGGIYVTGGCGGQSTRSAILLARFTDSPVLSWTRLLGSPADNQFADGICRTSDGNLAIGGTINTSDGVSDLMGGFVLKLNSSGQVLWGRRDPGHAPDQETRVMRVTTAADGRILALGRHTNATQYPSGEAVFATHWSNDGSWVVSQAYEAGANAYLYTSGGDLDTYYAGSTEGQGAGGEDVLILKTERSGRTCVPISEGPSFSSWIPLQQETYAIPTSFITPLGAWSPQVDSSLIQDISSCDQVAVRLQAWWPLEECQGAAVHDYTGYGADATNSGCEWIETRCGCALRVVDPQDIVRGIPASIDDRFADGFGVQATFRWFGPTGSPHPSHIFDARSVDRGCLLSIEPDGRLAFTFLKPGEDQTIHSAHTITPGVTTCVGAGWKPFDADFRIYINGVLDWGALVPPPYYDTDRPAAIGNNVFEDGEDCSFNGDIEAVRVYAIASGGECPECPADAEASTEISPVAPARVMDAVTLDPPSPNPAVGRTELSFHLDAAATVELSVWSIDGRKVAVVFNGPKGAGDHRMSWNWRDPGGRELPTGIYLVRLRTSAGDRVEKVCRIR